MDCYLQSAENKKKIRSHYCMHRFIRPHSVLCRLNLKQLPLILIFLITAQFIVVPFSFDRCWKMGLFVRNFNNYTCLVPDGLINSPKFLQFAERLKSKKEPPYIIMFDSGDLEMVKNHICNLKYFHGAFDRLAAIALDPEGELALFEYAPEVPVVTLHIAKDEISPNTQYRRWIFKQLIFVLRARISRTLSELGVRFWMMQQDTIWTENFSNLAIEANYSKNEMLFDTAGNENFYEFQTYAKNWFCGSTYFVKGSAKTACFFQKVESMLLTRPWYPDSAIMTYLCGNSGKCGVIPRKTVSCGSYFNTNHFDSPALLQIDLLSKGCKIDVLKGGNMYFMDDDGKCNFEPVVKLKDTVIHAFEKYRKPAEYVPLWWALYNPIRSAIKWDSYRHQAFLGVYELVIFT